MPRASRLSFELLETFLSVVEEGGDASRAAARLGINQPSMSKRLSQLQGSGASIGSPWLERSGKTWGMTGEGRRVFPAVGEVVRRHRALAEFADGSRRAAVVVFGCGQEAATSYVQRALRRLRRERPGVRMRISTMRGRARIEGVANGFLDLATVTFGEVDIRAIARRPLHVDHLRDDPLVLVANPSGRSGWGEALGAIPDAPVSAESLAGFPLILPEPDAGVRAHIDRDLESAGMADRLEVAMEVGGWSTILAFVRDGIGVGVISRSACPDPARGLWVRPLDTSQFRPIRLHLICRRASAGHGGLDLAGDAARFRDHLIACTTPEAPT